MGRDMFKGIDLEKEKVEVKPGDLFFVWNRAPFSILVAWMVNKARGNKKPITHAEIAAADGKNASAEAIGYVLVNRKNRFRKSKRLVILRYKEMTPKWDSVFSAIIGLLGKRYDFTCTGKGVLHYPRLSCPCSYISRSRSI